MQRNRQLLSRLVFLGLFAVAIVAIFLAGRFLSNRENPGNNSVVTVNEEYLPKEDGVPVLVEFSDFQCPACGLYYPLVRQMKEEFGDKLNVVYKHFPLSQLHRNANLAARASEAALNQGKFEEMHNMLFEKQTEWSASSQALSLFTAYAVSLGLDKDKFLKDIDSSATYDKVNANYQEGVRLGVGGTPTFFLNGKKISNPTSYEQFKTIIQNAQPVK